jgi:DNA-binding transcriptional MerR regulator
MPPGKPSENADLGSGELAAAAGVSVDTLRHYERRGLLPAARRLANGYRRFPASAAARVRLIQRSLAMGFGLDELTRILRARDGGRAPCREVRALAAEKLADVERRIESLAAFREELVRTLADWDRRLDAGRPSEPARLLETLSAVTDPESSASSICRGARFDRRRRKKEKPR